MVTAFWEGGNSGAVKRPVALMVPVEALPPATPFTAQARAGMEPSLAVAVNCCVPVPRTEALDGLTERAACGVGGELPTLPAQPIRRSEKIPIREILVRFTALAPSVYSSAFRSFCKTQSSVPSKPGRMFFVAV